MITTDHHNSVVTFTNTNWRIITHHLEEMSAGDVETIVKRIIPEQTEKAKKEFYEAVNELSGRFGKYE